MRDLGEWLPVFGRCPARIGGHLGIPTASIPADQQQAHFGFLAMVIVLDNPVTTLVTRRILGWEPVHPGLLADFDNGDYFTTPSRLPVTRGGAFSP
jgi:hypothetical protein